MFIALLEEICRRYRHSSIVHLVADNYIIHKSRKTQQFLASLGGRIVVHFLPPYSPEANPVERLWKQLHDHVTRNHQHATIESLMIAVEQFLHDVQPFPGTQVSTLPLVA